MNLVVGLYIYAVVLIGLSPGLGGKGCGGRGSFPEGRGTVIIVAILFNWKCIALNFLVLDTTDASCSQMKLKPNNFPITGFMAKDILYGHIYRNISHLFDAYFRVVNIYGDTRKVEFSFIENSFCNYNFSELISMNLH
jgi:hypothetical protein